ncbi:MAG: ADP-ribosylglycohydrolase family protein [Candidatus Latescibacteria bacterium]|nr:ADP-ribosylglycohydrolase family protein [Candidatus Latescibacterota bacterium]NIO28465.1 ADP-ribosylglycohydrolase family protein [Candidatus Latescibacterota bacterium]NIO56014.1 ADP-ribosylglycohydrolase family protein [Candidatus Latescibacterota bacterium]NIT01978.1 ADP-ribosylglycohydrolase family protein [Candidatus Latescibacterota bacterium]
MIAPTKEQFSGCLIGQCLGDALGFPVEGSPPEICQTYVSEMLVPLKRRGFAKNAFEFGQYTDDSQLAREMLQSYVEHKRFDPSDYAKRIAAIFKENRIVGRGMATDEAAGRLINGTPWEEAGTPPPSAGNGTAMRAGPIGLMFYDDPEKMTAAAHDQGRITHKDPRCSAGSIAVAGAVALSLKPDPINAEKFLSQLGDWMGKFHTSFAQFTRELADWIMLPPKDAVPLISTCGVGPQYHDGWWGISPFVISSVLWSLYSFLRTPDNYWETICTAISVGGDVDTTAAMAGAISGARLGLNRLPSELARHLTDQGTWGYSELIKLAERCFDIKEEQKRGETESS